MYIERHAIARLLETKPSNIKKTRQIEETIQVQLWDAKAPVVIPVQKYNDFLEEQRKQHSKLSTGGTKGISITLMGIGALVTISGCTMDTTVSTGFGQRVTQYWSDE